MTQLIGKVLYQTGQTNDSSGLVLGQDHLQDRTKTH